MYKKKEKNLGIKRLALAVTENTAGPGRSFIVKVYVGVFLEIDILVVVIHCSQTGLFVSALNFNLTE